jgi:hypothetical protein
MIRTSSLADCLVSVVESGSPWLDHRIQKAHDTELVALMAALSGILTSSAIKLLSSRSACNALQAFSTNMTAFWAFGGQIQLSGPDVSVVGQQSKGRCSHEDHCGSEHDKTKLDRQGTFFYYYNDCPFSRYKAAIATIPNLRTPTTMRG